MDILKSRRGIFMTLAALLILVMAFSILVYYLLYKNDRFLYGVTIGQVEIEGYTPDEATVIMDEWLQQVYQSPVIFSYGDFSYSVPLGDICLQQEAAQVVAQIWEKEKNRSFWSRIPAVKQDRVIHYPLDLNCDPAKMEAVQDRLNDSLARPFVNARLEVDAAQGLTIIAGEYGREVDIEETIAQLPPELEIYPRLQLDVVMANLPPQVDTEDLKVMVELASFSTRFNAQEINRTHNLRIAAAAIHNSLLLPGEVFSFNYTVGRRSVERGYREALIIINGKFEPGLAGGICQVSSTLYNIALLAGLDIVERHNHSLAIAYVPLGRDATVTYGLQDLKFKNNTEHPVYLRAVVSGNSLQMNVYGHEKHLQRVEITNSIDQVIDFETRREFDPELKPGQEIVDTAGNKGYIVRSFRTFYDSQGQVVRQEQLARDHYRPLHRLIKYGPDPVPDPTDEYPKSPTTGEENQ